MSELIKVHAMANMLGVSSTWLKKQAKEGKVPYLKAGRHYLFSPTAVIEKLTKEAATCHGGVS